MVLKCLVKGDFFISKINNQYSKEFKLSVVKRYFQGNGGYQTTANEMNIKNDSQVTAWVKKYNLLGETAFDSETRGKAKKPLKERSKKISKVLKKKTNI